MRGNGWLIGWLLVVGLSVGAFAGPLSGQWSVWGRLEYDIDERVMLVAFETLFEIDYTTCGWTLTGSALFSNHEFEYLWFTAGGSLGAIDFYSALTFGVPGTCGAVLLTNAPLDTNYVNNHVTIRRGMDFLSLFSSARMSIAGVDLYGIFAVLKQYGLIDNFNHVDGFAPKVNGLYSDSTIGAGLLVGGSGSAGDCNICVQIGFNFWRWRTDAAFAPCVCHYGWDWILPTFTPIECCDGWIGPDCMWWVDPTCCLCFSYATIYLEQSFACFDLKVDVLLSCDYGFDSIAFTLCDICLGLPWLELGALEVVFAYTHGIDSEVVGGYQKNVWGHFGLIVADCLCFTPYLSLDVDPPLELDGIALEALTVEYDMGQGVTFKAGHRFSYAFSWLDWEDCEEAWFMAFGETGDVVKWTDDMYCEPCLMPWDEYIGFMIDGDSCCGGHFDAWIFTWFETTLTSAFMDWAETRVKLDVDIGTNFTLMLKMSLNAQGLNWFTVGAETRW